jgi:hypothetical protein
MHSSVDKKTHERMVPLCRKSPMPMFCLSSFMTQQQPSDDVYELWVMSASLELRLRDGR